MSIQNILRRTGPALAAAAILLLSACEPAAPEPQIDWQPPGFELVDAAGETFRYPDDLDSPAIVLFWASWCPPCRAAMPAIDRIHRDYASRGVVVMGDVGGASRTEQIAICNGHWCWSWNDPPQGYGWLDDGLPADISVSSTWAPV